MDLSQQFPRTWKYQPYTDDSGQTTEEDHAYIIRMRTHLPNWPEEVLREWLLRHHGYHLETYGNLQFEHFHFSKQIWNLDDIPGREAFLNEKFCDDFQNIEDRASMNAYDWLAHYMLKEGTWNTPVVFLDNRTDLKMINGPNLKTPYHLLEGHRRLSFLQGLKRLKKARPKHEVWLIRVANDDLNFP